MDATERLVLTFGSGQAVPSEACVVTWTEHQNSPFYCIEPWMGTPNGIALGRGVKWIPPGKIGTFEVTLAAE